MPYKLNPFTRKLDITGGSSSSIPALGGEYDVFYTVGYDDADYIVDGTADNVQIQQAIDACEAAGGGVVFLKKGTYNLAATLTVSLEKGFCMRGTGWSTILKVNNSSNIYAITSNPPSSGVWAEFSDFKIDCNGDNQASAGGGIYAFGALQCLFNHLWITKPWGNGLYIYQDGAAGTGHHSRVINCLFDEGRQTNGGDGRALLIQASDEVMVMNSDFESNGRNAAAEPNHIYDRSGLNHYIGNVFVGGETAIKLEGTRSRVIGCMFDTIGSNHTIRVNGDNNVISNNVFYNIGYGTADPTYDGIYIDNCDNVSVFGNSFLSDNTGTRSGVNLANSSTGCVITDNIFLTQGNGYGTGAVIPGTGNRIFNNYGYTTNNITGSLDVSGITTIGGTNPDATSEAILNIEADWDKKLTLWGDVDEGYSRIEFRPERRTGADASDVQFTVHRTLHNTATTHKHLSLYTSNVAGTPTKRFNWQYGVDVAQFDINNTNVIINKATGTIPLQLVTGTAGAAAISQTPSDYAVLVDAVQSSTFKGLLGSAESPTGTVNSAIGVYDDGTGGKQGVWIATGNNTALTEAVRFTSAQLAVFAGDVSVPDEAYGSGWNGSLEVPTKNAVYDKIESLGGGVTEAQVIAYATVL